MNFYKILKIKKLGRGSPDFWTRLFANHTGGGSVKPIINVLTGRLPLTFSTSDTKLHDWTIHGNNDVGKNLLDITGFVSTHYAVRWYEDNGQLKASGTYDDNTAHSWPRFYVELSAGTYTLSGSPDYVQSGVRVQIGTCTDGRGSGFSSLGFDTGTGYTFTLQTNSWVSIRVYTASSLYQQTVDLTLPLMLRKAGTSEAFEPYQIGVGERIENGYQIPLITMDARTAEYVYRNNIFIGDSPLTEGESISKSSTGLDVKTIAIGADDYPNKLITSLSNVPEMTIKYKTKGGS